MMGDRQKQGQSVKSSTGSAGGAEPVTETETGIHAMSEDPDFLRRVWQDAASDMSELPLESGGFFYQRGESNWGASGKLEFRPSDMVQGYISAVYFDSDIGINKNKHALYGASSDGDSGTFWGGVGTARNDDIHYGVDDSLALTGALDFHLDDRNRVSLNGRISSSTSYQDFGCVDWYYGGPLSGSFTFNGTYYDATFDEPSDVNWIDTGNCAFNGYRRYDEELEKTVSTAKLDWVNASPFKRIGAEGALIKGITLDNVAPNSPKWQWSIGAQYEADLGDIGTLTPRIDVNYQSAFFSNVNNVETNKVDARTIANARLTWASPDDDWRVSLAVTNLFDKFYYLNKIDYPLGSTIGQPATPREWRISVRKNF